MSEFEVQNKSQILYFNDVAKQFEPIYEYGSSKYIVTKNGNGYKYVLYAMIIGTKGAYTQVNIDSFWNNFYESFISKMTQEINDLYVYYDSANEKNDSDVWNHMNSGLKTLMDSVNSGVPFLPIIYQIPDLFTKIVATVHNDGKIIMNYLNKKYTDYTQLLSLTRYTYVLDNVDKYIIDELRSEFFKYFETIIPNTIEEMKLFYNNLNLVLEYDDLPEDISEYNLLLNQFNTYYKKEWGSLQKIPSVNDLILFSVYADLPIITYDYFQQFLKTQKLVEVQKIELEVQSLYGILIDETIDLVDYYQKTKLDSVKSIFSIKNIINNAYNKSSNYMLYMQKLYVTTYNILVEMFDKKDVNLVNLNNIQMNYYLTEKTFNRSRWYNGRPLSKYFNPNVLLVLPLSSDDNAESMFNKYFEKPTTAQSITLFSKNIRPSAYTSINTLTSMNNPMNQYTKKMMQYIWNEWDKENLELLEKAIIKESQSRTDSKEQFSIFKPYPTTINIIDNIQDSVNKAFKSWHGYIKYETWRWPFYLKSGTLWVKIFSNDYVFYYQNGSQLLLLDFIPSYWTSNVTYLQGITTTLLKNRVMYNDPMTWTQIKTFTSSIWSCLADSIITVKPDVDLGNNYYCSISNNRGQFSIYIKDGDFYYEYKYERHIWSILSDETIAITKRDEMIQIINNQHATHIKQIQQMIMQNNLWDKCVPFVYDGSFLIEYMPYDKIMEQKAFFTSNNGTISVLHYYEEMRMLFMNYRDTLYLVYHPNATHVVHDIQDYILEMKNNVLIYKSTLGVLIFEGDIKKNILFTT